MFKTVVKGINYFAGKMLHRQNIFISGSLEYLKRKRSIDINYFDYVRLSSLELVANEIKQNNISGSVAELGVYKGKFAKFINKYFPDRTLYLFDTFEGFDSRDISKEKQQHYSDGSQDFSDTSVVSVLSKMPFPNKCVPVKGFFPDSAINIQDEFIFVSIDADLYDPIYSGLCFFYPKLKSGGYIFIHDFNNDAYKGAKKAVIQFCRENNINYFPLVDIGGSAIISK